jgi:glycerophosphoryl diester phosphodiesterase
MAQWPYPKWVAHRGAGKLAPENTLAAFKLGASHGYRMFECDVKLSSDGAPFLLHDDTLERTTNGHGIAGQQAWQALQQLDAGSWHSTAYAGEPIPSLDTIAAYCISNGFDLNIEIKPTTGTDERTGKVVAEHAARLWQNESRKPLLTSFKPNALQACCCMSCGQAG